MFFASELASTARCLLRRASFGGGGMDAPTLEYFLASLQVACYSPPSRSVGLLLHQAKTVSRCEEKVSAMRASKYWRGAGLSEEEIYSHYVQPYLELLARERVEHPYV